MGEERLIPAPPPARRGELKILDELPNALGLVLWQDVRHLRDWAETSPTLRSVLFNPDTSPEAIAKRRDARALANDLSGAFATFASLKAEPVKARVSDVAAACEQVVSWALQHDHTQTAIEWAEVAAIVDEVNPKAANLAGRVTRMANEYDRAERWFQRGVGFARRQDDTIELIRGHLGYGRLCTELGRVKGARVHLNAGANLARKGGPPSLAAEAQHDLCAMLMVRGHLTEAAKRAQRALVWYPKNHHRIPFFAADVGLMLVLAQRFYPAAKLLRLVLRHVKQPSARATIIALTARAVAGAGEPEESAVLRHRAFKLLEKHRGMEPVTRWHLADAQRLLGNWDAAEVEAEAALAASIAHNDREIARLTHVLRNLINARRSAVGRPAGPDLRQFLRQLASRVESWSPRRERQWNGPWGNTWAA